MPAIIIDGKEYEFDMLSEDAKKSVNTLHFIDAEISRLQSLIAVQQTARTVYVGILQKELAHQVK